MQISSDFSIPPRVGELPPLALTTSTLKKKPTMRLMPTAPCTK